jgi:hypothetical protein
MTSTRFLLLLLTLLAVPGCLEIENNYTLNPDGSGRVDVQMRYDMSGLPAVAMPVGDGLKEFARNLVSNSTGIEVWSDVKAKKSGEGILTVSGRGYFRDLSAVVIDGSYPIGFRLRTDGATRVVESFDLPSDITSTEGSEPDTASAGQPGDSSTADETFDIISSQLEELKVIGAEKLAKLGQRMTFRLPGTISGAGNGFITDPDGRMTLSITGSRMLAVVDSVRNDEAFRRRYQYEKNFPWSRLLFGDSMPSLTFTPQSKPLFDYAKEVAAAKKRFPQLKRELGIK